MHAMEYCSALKRKSCPYATTQMVLEDVMLSEISQGKKNKNYRIPLI